MRPSVHLIVEAADNMWIRNGLICNLLDIILFQEIINRFSKIEKHKRGRRG